MKKSLRLSALEDYKKKPLSRKHRPHPRNSDDLDAHPLYSELIERRDHLENFLLRYMAKKPNMQGIFREIYKQYITLNQIIQRCDLNDPFPQNKDKVDQCVEEIGEIKQGFLQRTGHSYQQRNIFSPNIFKVLEEDTATTGGEVDPPEVYPEPIVGPKIVERQQRYKYNKDKIERLKLTLSELRRIAREKKDDVKEYVKNEEEYRGLQLQKKIAITNTLLNRKFKFEEEAVLSYKDIQFEIKPDNFIHQMDFAIKKVNPLLFQLQQQAEILKSDPKEVEEKLNEIEEAVKVVQLEFDSVHSPLSDYYAQNEEIQGSYTTLSEQLNIIVNQNKKKGDVLEFLFNFVNTLSHLSNQIEHTKQTISKQFRKASLSPPKKPMNLQESQKGLPQWVFQTQRNDSFLDAVFNGDLKEVKKLVERKQGAVDINSSYGNNVTAALIAARLGHNEILKYLIKQGACLNTPETSMNVVPIREAVMTGNVEGVKSLLSAKADIRIRDSDSYTLLGCAVQEGHVEIVKLLKSAGALVSEVSKNGPTLALIAADKGNVEMINILLEPTDNRSFLRDRLSSSNNWSPLAAAAYNKDIKLVRCLLKWGADPNSALPYAIDTEWGEGVKELLEAGADPNRVSQLDQADKNDRTPLCYAFRIENERIIDCLLRYGSDPNQRLNDGNTPLRLAELENKQSIVSQVGEHIVQDKNITRWVGHN
jgi:ankyrin repeat protein